MKQKFLERVIRFISRRWKPTQEYSWFGTKTRKVWEFMGGVFVFTEDEELVPEK